MTNDEAKAIGLRAVACRGWREMPGVLLRHREYDNFRLRIGDERETPGTLGDAGPLSRAGWTVGSDGEMAGSALTWADLWPDFRDPATLGCLLALVREVWAEAVRQSDLYDAQVVVVETRWESCRRARWVVCPDGGRLGAIGAGATEIEAIVAALEAA